MLSQSFILKTDETTLVGSNQSNYKHCALIRCILRCGMVMGSFVHQVKHTKIPNISKRLLIKSLKQTNICNFNSNGTLHLYPVCKQLFVKGLVAATKARIYSIDLLLLPSSFFPSAHDLVLLEEE